MKLHRFFWRISFIFLNFIMVHSVFSQAYFQQQVNYKINVKLNDKKHTLSAYEELEYINNSPDVLNEIWMHLWPNAYKNNSSSLVKQQVENGDLNLFFASEEDRGFIDSLDFKVNGVSVPFEYKEVDFGKIKLTVPLQPGQRLIITTPFFVKIPDAKFSRLGHDHQAYYISQWYPKPAVYDANGWHPMPYLDQGEFYSEFGNYLVTIELPRNYVVGATGVMMNDSNEYVWMSQNAMETEKSASFSHDMSFPPSDTLTKKLIYSQNDVHDFAWFADKRWHVLKGEVTLPHTKRKVTTWSMFTNDKADSWKKSIEYINNALYYYSLWNGDYLYDYCTAVDGVIIAGTGMEYPMITVCGGEPDSFLLDATIAHEVGHNWFYGMLGSNERDDPWMDEGINSFNEMRYMLTRYPKEEYGNRNELMADGSRLAHLIGFDNLDYKEAWQLEYKLQASKHADQPICSPSTSFTETNYGTIVYRKTGIVFQYLRSYLGDTLFDSCMQQYFNKWKLKHPSPSDFKASIVIASRKHLDWFFNDLMTTTKTLDYKIKGINKSGNSYTLNIGNKGDINSPFEIYGLRNNKVIATSMQEGFLKREKINFDCSACDAFEIDHYHNMPDINRRNNSIRTKGIFKKADPIAIRFIPKIESNGKTDLNFFPAVGHNEYNKFMLGAVFYNEFIPVKHFEYAIAPLYGFGDHQLAGCGTLNFNVFNRAGIFEFIRVNLKGKRFAYINRLVRKGAFNYENVTLHYNRLEPGISFLIRKNDLRSEITNRFGVSMIELVVENTVLKERVILNDSTRYNITGVENDSYQTFRAYYRQNNNRKLDPYGFNLQFEGNNEYGKLEMTGNYKFNYRNSRKGIECRLFAGSFLYNDDKANVQYPFNLSAWDGQRDYWFDEYYFGRSESTGILSQQMSMNEGGFKMDIPYARVTSWMASVNLKAAFPGKLPVKAFLDIGTFKNAKQQIVRYNDNVLIDGGVYISIVDDALECYFPFIRSKGIKNYIDDQQLKFGNQIRFIFNLNLLNPLNLRKQLLR